MIELQIREKGKDKKEMVKRPNHNPLYAMPIEQDQLRITLQLCFLRQNRIGRRKKKTGWSCK
ncbi:hypothetical protein M419DRAFT_124919 [Trichoderma reesei RUT C-30]|jgi:hypothetical protein|uniref:Uncharacterized protein n=1 Tax=Hypocrea jecorina (strain ATCC 56765 / BCRC 32924 / NRRL 11460 / Rut C-30) TaxID=1344414 RepID=A0A024RYG3_HYPJR|nr:hypothetical protein M419DRAFT_124919 [Trichoderma reesei RUT C-30]